jgi:uncharacterized protein
LLTADLVRARRRGAELRLSELDTRSRAEALELAALLIDLATRHLGKTRAELDEVCEAVVGGARDRRLAAGIRKLVEDRCEFAEEAEIEPAQLRREVFAHSRAAWAALAAAPGARFDRQAVLAAVAAERSVAIAAVESGLYADLRAAQVLTAVNPISALHLVEAYELAQPQAVLLRAVRVTVAVESAVPGAYRTLFRKLKFLRLLCSIQKRAVGPGYILDIDGPYSLFESATRYGLALALALPAIRELDHWKLSAEIRWGTERTPLTCQLEGHAIKDATPLALPDEVAALVTAIAALETAWKVTPATALLDLPGVGVCVPDLVFRHSDTGVEIYLEVLGYWSRAAVWRRVELVQAGLGHRIVFAVGQQLRVSESVLDDDLPGALYVYKRTMSARAVLERVEALAAAAPTPAVEPAAASAKRSPRRRPK